MRVVKGERASQYRNDSMDLLKRSLRLVNNVKLLSFLKESPRDKAVVDIRSVLEDSISEVKRTFPELDPDIEIDIPEESLFVEADDLLDQVFINIINNAVKAQKESKPWIRVESEVLNGNVLVRVMDKGSGFPEGIKEVVLDRMEISKRRKKRSGLGLMIVKALMDKYDGEIMIMDRVKGDHSKGSCIVLKFKRI